MSRPAAAAVGTGPEAVCLCTMGGIKLQSRATCGYTHTTLLSAGAVGMSYPALFMHPLCCPAASSTQPRRARSRAGCLRTPPRCPTKSASTSTSCCAPRHRCGAGWGGLVAPGTVSLIWRHFSGSLSDVSLVAWAACRQAVCRLSHSRSPPSRCAPRPPWCWYSCSPPPGASRWSPLVSRGMRSLGGWAACAGACRNLRRRPGCCVHCLLNCLPPLSSVSCSDDPSSPRHLQGGPQSSPDSFACPAACPAAAARLSRTAA